MAHAVTNVWMYLERIFQYLTRNAIEAVAVFTLGISTAVLVAWLVELFCITLHVPERIVAGVKNAVATAIMVGTVALTFTLLGLPFYYALVTYGVWQFVVTTAALPLIRRVIEGFVILGSLPMQVGSHVAVDGVRGRVVRYGLTRVTLRDDDSGIVYSLPNDQVSAAIVAVMPDGTTQLSQSMRRRMDERRRVQSAVYRQTHIVGGGMLT